ncbi:MAG TPA: fumarylacetoacetate hydrolase family protein [Bryobacteraceae bacterium]|nr:fumarylacetoacetate hydrolase family protein [Bryobacteraceae bacterium]
MRLVRYTLDPATRPTAGDGDPAVRRATVEEMPVSAQLLPPCTPSKIVCVGRNYAEHARELGNETPKEPLIFLKPPSSLIASGDAIVWPAISQRVDFEGELGVVMARRARHVRQDQAMDYVLGYTCVNDVTARDLQKSDGQWTRGKGFDTFCAVGPCLTPKEELPIDSIRLRTRVDGVVRQEGSPREMIFSIAAIIEFVTDFMTLEPGDLIATGTPPGVGSLQPGSTVEVDIEGIGVLRNTVIREER